MDEGGTRPAAPRDDYSKAMRRKPRRRPDPPPSTGWGKIKRWAGFEKKTLWDWLQLLVVPLMLVLVGFGFAWQQDARQDAIEDRRAENERTVEDQRAQDTALQAYLDQMGGLMIGEEPLRDSEQGSAVRTLARARTATVVRRLDAERNQDVMRFLGDAGLLGQEIRSELSGHPLFVDEFPPFSLLTANDLRGAALNGAVMVEADLTAADLTGANMVDAILRDAILRGVRLSGADLRGADLSGAPMTSANLSDANLSGANLSGAILSGAILEGADLSGADLSGADLNAAYFGGADLSGANLEGARGVIEGARGVTKEDLEAQAETLKGTTMPDGSKHP